ncbi:MAG: hypothetical protein IMZ47_03080 [Firmicutes bacterium]|nr:hypothetical protein [Bacillota bacterium]
MFEEPTKVFPCDCLGEGIAVTKEYDKDDISDNEVLVQESTWMREFQESPYISLSFWEFGHARHGRFSLWLRIKMAFLFVFRKKHFWEDMVTMKADHARNFANHILYIIAKGEREKKMGEPIVKDGLPVIDWPKNDIIREDKATPEVDQKKISAMLEGTVERVKALSKSKEEENV